MVQTAGQSQEWVIFMIQTKGKSWLVTLPYAASIERGATMQNTEEWLMNLPPASFNQFSRTCFKAVRLVKHTVVWIPYGWVSILVNMRGQLDSAQALVIPYLNAKLALDYPSIGLLVTFHAEFVKANQEKRCEALERKR